jgi:hypothetical protein
MPFSPEATELAAPENLFSCRRGRRGRRGLSWLGRAVVVLVVTTAEKNSTEGAQQHHSRDAQDYSNFPGSRDTTISSLQHAGGQRDIDRAKLPVVGFHARLRRWRSGV